MVRLQEMHDGEAVASESAGSVDAVRPVCERNPSSRALENRLAIALQDVAG
jgi:hypothetical protein